MQLKHLFLSLLAAATCRAAAVGGAELCGTAPPTEEFLQAHKEAAAEEAAAAASGDVVKRDVFYVNTYVHIIAASESLSDGYVDNKTVDAQIQVLNDNFSNSGYQFVLQNISRLVDSQWSDIYNGQDLTQLKQSLHKGYYGDLNLYYFRSVYTDSTYRTSLTGFCPYPDKIADWPFFYNDGCSLHFQTMPGGTFSPWNQGKITSHEVGHWFGLIHPWGNFTSGGCYPPGDYVDDTPPQDQAVYGCDENSASCGGNWNDPIHNYMGYNDNSCVNQFTNGQITRMASMYKRYRT
ncbi:metalloprotease 1 [Cordyceps fumosorosea ARSEF 2679]|uniref:Metalloprotease 1 n=1 Tax=Cordyceps fumosorosea (strain ARSEF 2679) TaxID=1081104 RepID=A0A167YBX5_CORFA|nr:metalloprotease 1 [Cordyceps fumosorosea ARSEF 2679]OAA66136.1 metalloprotease 1 [Cordyceps fumosorosea ARSEF 2679]